MDVMDEWSLPEAEAELTPHCVQGEDEEDEDEEEDEQTRDEPSSFTNPSIRSHTGVISSVCSTSQWKLKCVRCVCVCLDLIWKQVNIWMFHSVRKHAEHRTLNTFTEQFLFLFFSSLGYTEHDGTNRTRLDILL